MKGESVKYRYNTHVEWLSEKKGILKSDDKPDIKIACPPEFGGHPGIWSPEDFFVASVEVCMLTTFLWYKKRENIGVESYKSKAFGIVEMEGGVFKFSSINVDINVILSDINDIERVEKIFKKVKRACLISNSIETEVNIKPKITVE